MSSDERRLIVFRSRLRAGVEAEYGEHADKLYALAEQMPGFVSSKDFEAEDGERLALIEFASPGELAAWREHPEHERARARGRSEWFSSYSIQICQVLREGPPAPSPRVAVDLAGGCACGSVRYRVRGTPQSETLCHCSDCRRASGATPVAWATFRKSELGIEGTLRERASSERARRGFCPECGAQLVFWYLAEPEHVDLALATLDDPDAISARDHIWVRSRPGWSSIGDDLPRFERTRPAD